MKFYGVNHLEYWRGHNLQKVQHKHSIETMTDTSPVGHSNLRRTNIHTVSCTEIFVMLLGMIVLFQIYDLSRSWDFLSLYQTPDWHQTYWFPCLHNKLWNGELQKYPHILSLIRLEMKDPHFPSEDFFFLANQWEHISSLCSTMSRMFFSWVTILISLHFSLLVAQLVAEL